jgi:hypothetical protein
MVAEPDERAKRKSGAPGPKSRPPSAERKNSGGIAHGAASLPIEQFPWLSLYLRPLRSMQHRLVAIDGEPKDLISKLRQPLLMRLSAAGPSFFELTRKVFFNRRRQGGTF